MIIKILLLLFFVLAGTGIVLLQLDIVRNKYIQKKQSRIKAYQAKGISLRVVDRKELSQQHFSVCLQAVNNIALPRFQPGQYITLLSQIQPQPHKSNNQYSTHTDQVKQQKRCYSLSSWQEKPDFYELCIHREDNGLVSSWLYENLHPGLIINALPPKGSFFINSQPTSHIVLIAGGIGITPLRAMIHKFVAQKSGGPSLTKTMHLFYAAKSPDRMCYLDELIDLANQHNSFYFYPTLSIPEKTWQGSTDRLTVEVILKKIQQDEEHSLDKTNCHYYMCGPEEMMSNMTQGLTQLGIPRKQIHSERFGLNLTATADKEFSIKLGSKKPFSFQKQRSLLQALEQEGVEVESECRSGGCGQCKIKIRQGKVKQLIETDVTLATSEFLACCSIPESDLLIDL